jgi:hypothetical protein
MPLYTTVDDELYDELAALAGQKIVYVEVWEDSLSSALEVEAEDQADQVTFDMDIYLADGAYFELYSTACYASLDDDPWLGLETVQKHGVYLDEIAVDEEDQLVLVLRYGDDEHLYLPVAAWLLAEWDELPGV